MKPGIKRTMRVATTFTGAACTVAAFNNPAAMAGTGRPAAQPGYQHNVPRIVGGNTPLSGSIRVGNCADTNASHWLHIESPYNGGSCYGYRGLLLLSPWPNMRAYCGGNNSGVIWGWDNLHSYEVYVTFGQGTTYAHLPKSNEWFYISELGIEGWHGNDKCGPL